MAGAPAHDSLTHRLSQQQKQNQAMFEGSVGRTTNGDTCCFNVDQAVLNHEQTNSKGMHMASKGG